MGMAALAAAALAACIASAHGSGSGSGSGSDGFGSKPHILMVVVDDLGFNNVGWCAAQPAPADAAAAPLSLRPTAGTTRRC